MTEKTALLANTRESFILSRTTRTNARIVDASNAIAGAFKNAHEQNGLHSVTSINLLTRDLELGEPGCWTDIVLLVSPNTGLNGQDRLRDVATQVGRHMIKSALIVENGVQLSVLKAEMNNPRLVMIARTLHRQAKRYPLSKGRMKSSFEFSSTKGQEYVNIMVTDQQIELLESMFEKKETVSSFAKKLAGLVQKPTAAKATERATPKKPTTSSRTPAKKSAKKKSSKSKTKDKKPTATPTKRKTPQGVVVATGQASQTPLFAAA